MSQFYDLSSLVVIPSGYKASTIYAQKPLTTDGQLSFSRASTATRVNASGLIEAVASNVPRLDYLGSSCPRLLLEPQRTNLALYSEQFDNANWQKIRSTINANAATAPDGTLSADTFTDTTFTNSPSAIDTPIGATISQAYTHSIFVKAGTAPFIYIGLYDIAAYVCILNASTGQITFTTSGATSSVVSYGNGWYRLSITLTVASVIIYPYFGVCQFSNTNIYSGTGAYTAQFWGAQVEAGAYATSYIPTLGASVTRVKDECIKTGVSSLIGQTEGTVFVEFKMNGQSLSEDVYSNNKNLTGSISIQATANGQLLGFICYNGTFIQFVTSTGVLQLGQNCKIALAYKSGNSAFYVNGNQISTSATAFAFTTTLSEIDIANNGVFFAHLNNKEVSQVLQFNTRLTNAQLAELTTL
jgi:hypothetical protein